MPSSKNDLKIGVTGCMGRMGKNVLWEILSGQHDGIALGGGTVREGHPNAGQDIGTLMNQKPQNIVTTVDPAALFDHSDLIIDFTSPDAAMLYTKLAVKHKTALVTGTTGLTSEQEQVIFDAAKTIPVIYAANMSLGVNFLLAFVEQMADRLGPEWDIEIAETHHHDKIDAPSGTALALGKAAAKSRGTENFVFDRNEKRPPGAIGFAVQRGGDIPGEHTVTFFGQGERIELTHRAGRRALFARGAIRAALWLKDQPPGLYSMQDVLNL